MPLPELCSRCRKLKARELGRFVRAKNRHERKFVCDSCLDKSQGLGHRQGMARRPSRLELEAVASLAQAGLRFIREYRIENFQYDFAIPRLRLLVEIDGPFGHRGRNRRQRDEAKEELALRYRWSLERVRVPDVAGKVACLMQKRMEAFGLT